MNDFALSGPFDDLASSSHPHTATHSSASSQINGYTGGESRNVGGSEPSFGVYQPQAQVNGDGSGNGNTAALQWAMPSTSFLAQAQALPHMQQQQQLPTSQLPNAPSSSPYRHQHQQQQQQGSPSANMHLASSGSGVVGASGSSVDRNNAFLSLLAEMPNATDDPARHAMWMQAVQYKTKSLELDIAEARRKEREAELELARLKAVVDRRSSFRHADPQPTTPQGSMVQLASTSQAHGQGHGQGYGQTGGAGGGSAQGSGNSSMANTGQLQLNVPLPMSEQTFVPQSSTRSHSFTTATYPYLHTRPMLGPAASPQEQKANALPDVSAAHPHPHPGSRNPGMLGQGSQILGTGDNTQREAITPFDLEALLSSSNMESMFNWLPDMSVLGGMGSSASGSGAGAMSGMSAGMAQGIDPNTLRFASTNPMDAYNGSAIELESDYLPGLTPIIKSEPELGDTSAPLSKRKESSGAESATAADDLPPIKRSRRGIEKKVTVEQTVHCPTPTCKKLIARVMVRALRSQLPESITSSFKCLSCRPVERPVLPDPAITGTSIGTVETRKRARVGVEIEDEESGTDARRQFCDVCQRIIGSGSIRGGKSKVHVGHLAEIICASCDVRYQRCTDCGGGGGPRLNVGKWRLKEVFPPGRKTCSLSHSRLGDRQRDIGVHVTPSDFTPEQLNEVLTRCKGLWQEKNLSRLAVPEMMEMDLPPNLINPLHSYADIEKIIVENWPAREAMIKAEGADPSRFKRILGLTWAHTKPRRTVRTVDIEEEHSRTADADDGEDQDRSTVIDNVRKTNVVIPAGCELIGMWGGEWDMQHGSLLISTFIPFEGTDGEDSAALSVGEIISKVQKLQANMNDEIEAAADGYEGEEERKKVPACEHLWVVSGSTVPLVRERMADILTRKRSFVHLEEYLTRHPDFANAVRDRPYGLHPSSLALPDPANAGPQSPQQDQSEKEAKEASRNSRPLILARWLGNDFGPDKIREIKEMEFGGKRLKRKAKKDKGVA